jgi:hypothetical protein
MGEILKREEASRFDGFCSNGTNRVQRRSMTN